MRRIAVAVCSRLLSAISKLTGLSSARTSLKFIVVMLALMLPASLIFFAPNLRATSNIITVTNTTDTGAGSLRAAITSANGSPTVATTINFSVSGTVTLASALPAIANTSPGSLTIDGTGQTITVDGANSFQVLVVNSGATLTVNDLTIAHGNAPSIGGGIANVGGTLTVSNSTFSTNTGTGGGIYNSVTATVTNSTFSGNIAN